MKFKAFYEAESEMTKLADHLRSRGLDPNRTGVVVDEKTGIATFFLYNLSGKLVGYQHYNPAGEKGFSHKNSKVDKMLMKYYSYVVGRTNDNTKEIAVWGLDTYDLNIPYLFVVEGIFDAVSLHNAGVPAVALLANDPSKSTLGWIHTLPQKKIVIYDNDQAENKDKKNTAGLKLRKAGNVSYTVPAPYKDLNEMPQEEVNMFVRRILDEV